MFGRRLWIQMVIDLKVLVRSFNCESRACYVRNPRESFFRVRESNICCRESFAKVGYYNHDIKGCHPLPPGLRQEKGTREFLFGSGSVPCVVVLLDNHLALHR